MIELDIVIDEKPVTVQVVVSESPLNFTFVTATPNQIYPGASPVYITRGSAVELNFLLVPAPQIEVTITGEAGPPGIPGPRGSLFLGKYPAVVNLPPFDGSGVRVGDTAYINQTGELYVYSAN